MLVLAIKPGESIHIGDNVKLTYSHGGYWEAVKQDLYAFTAAGTEVAYDGTSARPGTNFAVYANEPFVIPLPNGHASARVLYRRRTQIRLGIDAPREIRILRDKHLTTA